MGSMERVALLIGAVNGFLAVALGAFGAHGLKRRLGQDAVQRLAWWETAAHYQLTHAVALLAAGYLVARAPGLPATVAVWSLTAGIGLFSGSLYVMTLTGVRALGMVTPLGGLCLLAGWVAMAVAAARVG